MSTTRSPPVPALFTLPLPTPSPLVLTSANISIYLIQPSETGLAPAAYSTPILYISGSGPILGEYMQFLKTRFSLAIHTSPDTGLIPAAYIQSPGTKTSPTTYK